MKRAAVLVNTCDRYTDCWIPFFRLWETYGWKDGRLYLNTERADFRYPGTELTALRVCERYGWQKDTPPTWSWCFARALESIEEDIILYMQEDYFLTAPADTECLRTLVQRMEEDPTIDCIHLSNIGITLTGAADSRGLCPAKKEDTCYASLQGALWRKRCLQELVREHESAWDWEYWAAKRAKRSPYHFYVAAPSPEPPLRYLPLTAVVQGKWNKEVPSLLERHGISGTDYSVRGFYEGPFGRRGGRLRRYHLTHLKACCITFRRRFLSFRSMAAQLRLILFGAAPHA